MIYQVFDIDGTVLTWEYKPYPKVIKFIQELNLKKNKLIFLTARWDYCYEDTRDWLKREIGHNMFDLYCRVEPSIRIAEYKKQIIEELTKDKPEKICFYDDDPLNVEAVRRFKESPDSNYKDIEIYLADQGEMHLTNHGFSSADR